MSEWHEISLGEALHVKHGFAFKGENFRDAGHLIVLTPGNFHDTGGFKDKDGKEKYYEGQFPDGYLLKRGDIVIAMTEQAPGLLGSSATIPADGRYLHNQRIGLLCFDNPDLVDPRYTYHLMNTPAVRNQIQASATGVKVRHTAPERIGRVRAVLPPIATQRKVASLLDAMDDLIERNVQRVNLLEQMARDIYREWFVDFRYPGHNGVPLIGSEFGPIPEGWEVDAASDRLRVELGGTPSRACAEYWSEGTIHWINSSQLNGLRVMSGVELITDDAVRHSNTKIMPPRTILIAITGATLGQVSLLETSACFNQSVVGVFDRSVLMNEFLYLQISYRIGSIVSKASGAAQQHINKAVIEETRLLFPTIAILETFRGTIHPVFDLLADILRTTDVLRVTRDLLLPRLVSGRIDVSKIELPEAV